jgi:hypothetical protein
MCKKERRRKMKIAFLRPNMGGKRSNDAIGAACFCGAFGAYG